MNAVPLTVVSDSLPASRKVFAPGRLHPRAARAHARDRAAPVRRGAAARVYDSSGPYTDPAVRDRHRAGPAAPARGVDPGAARMRPRAPAGRCGRRTTASPQARAGARADLPRAPPAAQGARRRGGHPARLRPRRASSLRRWSSSPSARTSAASSVAPARRATASPGARPCRISSPRSSCAPRWPRAGPSSRPTSITRSPSR